MAVYSKDTGPQPEKLPTGTKSEDLSSEPDELSKIMEDCLNVKLEKVAPKETRVLLSRTSALNIVKKLADTQGILPQSAWVAVCLLFGKGAANKGTPNSLDVTILDDNRMINIRKDDLLYVYKAVEKNLFLRRMAEALAPDIAKFFLTHGLEGDLAKKINTRLANKGQPPLNPIEKAWCSSFCQGDDGTYVVSERLPVLLAEDYYQRFRANNKKETEKKLPPAKIDKRKKK